MEKVFIKPISKELIHKGAPGVGHTDIFAYNSESAGEEKLGSLFVVGHVQHETDDVAYMVNLMAALAKREYYARPGLGPKESFTSTLKKINEVVQDFFKNSGLTVNVGIFVIADDQIYISRLGKFKIVLARNGKNIDILNNIDLFEKEHIQDKEFSNIISGKVLEGDRILAFYPAQPVASRERYIKSYFLNLAEVDFIHKISQIKTTNPAFSCALLYIDMHKVRQAAKEPRPQPHELEVTLAKSGTAKPSARPTRKQVDAPAPRPAQDHQPEPVRPTPPLPDPVVQEMPRIISAEFSVGKRDSFVQSVIRRFTIPGLNLRNKLFIFTATTVGIIALTFVAKTFFIIDPEVRKLNAAVQDIRTDIKLAQTKLSQNSVGEARELLLSSLTAIQQFPASEQDKAREVRGEVFEVLDGIDQAQEASPVLISQLTSETGTALLLTVASTSQLYVYTKAEQSGLLLTVRDNSVAETKEVKDMEPSNIFNSSNGPVLFDAASGKVMYNEKGALETTTLELPGAVTGADLYQDNLYFTTAQSIFKVNDAAIGAKKVTAWLKEESIAPESFRLVVDGDLYVMAPSGTITKYYKGARAGEFRTGLMPSPDSLLISTVDSPNLFVIEKSLNRIYVIDKKTGNLAKTYRIDSPISITTAAVDANDTIYFLTTDNKIWRLQ